MCDYCNPKMYDREVYYDTDSDSWFLDVETGEWSDYDDDFVHIVVGVCAVRTRRTKSKLMSMVRILHSFPILQTVVRVI